ncbi:unnamed protein product [Rotaria magnacalcarata]|uniref:EF-hand domain-containing protein n=2 Tax=Rotaria magnacalcarata TaxID=392030 RepID=A0A816YWI6_9BILA|nr:unnamed protein product [Rotaria magnacalcarata]CAF1587213.1 unnamed protein product [Rotaria magnacalcarata]CAF2092101.1 unnamed protein product [Rotaria magnacalcarata]CAF2132419.1 unnamed protein product [Rotaria magnacalcarata]CAF2164842.1 unnamed protein product [Rotaria magnacalcarata]
MRFSFLVFLLSVYRINGHDQHNAKSPIATGGQSHISRKLEDHVHDTNHIKKDLQGQINKSTEQLTEEEQNFYYFKLHDTNNDNRLDGLEVIAAFNHEHKDNVHNHPITDENNTTTPHPDDEDLTDIIDDILEEEDLNHDGYITYEEFKHALQNDKTIED